jgi:hypothetical protein
LVIEWNVREEGCHVDDVRVGRNSECLRDFSRDENGFIAFPQASVAIIVVFVVIPLSVSESGERRQGYRPARKTFGSFYRFWME